MKKIEAFIRHEAFDEIRNRLADMGLPSMSISEVKGSGRQGGYTESYRGAKTTIFMRPDRTCNSIALESESCDDRKS